MLSSTKTALDSPKLPGGGPIEAIPTPTVHGSTEKNLDSYLGPVYWKTPSAHHCVARHKTS